MPGEGIEPPTNGLQNRCSTAELTRLKRRATSVADLPQVGTGKRVLPIKKSPAPLGAGRAVKREKLCAAAPPSVTCG